MELNKYIPSLPSGNEYNNTEESCISEILLWFVPNSWSNQAYLQVFGAETNTSHVVTNLFERCDIVEFTYKGSPERFYYKVFLDFLCM